ncbi:LicD family protein [uncultured Bacteroides sp.]|uniref:LicD family protein n=1 Tax=uncultured Bacteroides sp. TaxID=162156 RepID=UPI002592549C|nr:LicD family protein [uncultured Bacteroides sp.]
MQEITLEERKKLQFEILCSVHDFCVENDITYFLSSGTLIGAVRHQGYIPWDDDIDIAMPRKDYDRFFQSYSSQYHKAINLNMDVRWPYAFGRVCDTRTLLKEKNMDCVNLGICIDVFPMDGLPDSNFRCKIHLLKIFVIRYLIAHKYYFYQNQLSRLRNIYHLALKYSIFPLPIPFLLKKRDSLIRKYDWQSSTNVASLASTTERIPCNKSCFTHMLYEKFEGQLFCIPCGYDIWLRLIYGDYLKLPPVEKRIIQHDFIAYWK